MSVAALAAFWSRLAPNVRGGLWLLASALSFSVLNGMIKSLGQEMHPFQIAFFRCLFGFLVIAPFALRHGFSSLRTGHLKLHALRWLCGIGAILTSFWAIANMPLAGAVAIFFSKTLFTIPLAILFLGEKVGWRRGLATLLGFSGVVVMLHPGGGIGLSLAAIVALVQSVLVAVVLILIKKLTATETPTAMVFYFSAAATVGTFIPSLMVWVWPNGEQLLLLVAAGAVASLAQYQATRAYRVGEATAVTPFDYSQLLFAALIGFVFFGEQPDGWTIAGAAIIAASTLYILRREAKLRKAGR